MYVILALVVLLAAALFFLGARALMAVQEGRRRRAMADRLAAVVVQAKETHRQRTEVAESGAALTALLPAIQQAKEGPRRVA
jgi:Na+-translocating ferredoxin:NAD+ oxidoreductase RnfD subunit